MQRALLTEEHSLFRDTLRHFVGKEIIYTGTNEIVKEIIWRSMGV